MHRVRSPGYSYCSTPLFRDATITCRPETKYPRHWRKLRNQGAAYLLQRAALKSRILVGSRLLRQRSSCGMLFVTELVGRSLPSRPSLSSGGGGSQTSLMALHRPVLSREDHADAGRGIRADGRPLAGTRLWAGRPLRAAGWRFMTSLVSHLLHVRGAQCTDFGGNAQAYTARRLTRSPKARQRTILNVIRRSTTRRCDSGTNC